MVDVVLDINDLSTLRTTRLLHAATRLLVRINERFPTHAPQVKELLKQLAAKRFPEFLRFPTWLALLGINVKEATATYRERSADVAPTIISEESGEDTARVIVEDVKRAFSTNPVIANDPTRQQLARVLFSFVQAGEDYCQGIHSVVSVFISLSFNEALASACLHRFEASFVRLYTPENFRPYFVRFAQLLAFHCPPIASLLTAKIIENSTAIRWFLPLLSLSMKLETIYSLWDYLLQDVDTSRFMFFLIAFLRNAKDRIVRYKDRFELILELNRLEFNNVALFERSIIEAEALAASTPPSYRQTAIDASHPAVVAPFVGIANTVIDDNSSVLVPLLDLNDLIMLFAQNTMLVDTRKTVSEASVKRKTLHVPFTTAQDVARTIQEAVQPESPDFIVIAGEWNNADMKGAVLLGILHVCHILVEKGHQHVCMSDLALSELSVSF